MYFTNLHPEYELNCNLTLFCLDFIANPLNQGIICNKKYFYQHPVHLKFQGFINFHQKSCAGRDSFTNTKISSSENNFDHIFKLVLPITLIDQPCLSRAKAHETWVYFV